MRYSLRPLFTCPPNSAEELFQKIKHCISVFNPEWVKKIKPDSDKDIRYLEKLVMQTYGTPLPASYKMYLQEMGTADGGLFSEYLTYEMSRFYGRMACGAADEIEDLLDRSTKGQEIKESPSEPPYWHFALSQFSGEAGAFLLALQFLIKLSKGTATLLLIPATHSPVCYFTLHFHICFIVQPATAPNLIIRPSNILQSLIPQRHMNAIKLNFM